MQLTDVRYLRRELEEYRALARSLPDGGCWHTAALEKKLLRQADHGGQTHGVRDREAQENHGEEGTQKDQRIQNVRTHLTPPPSQRKP